MKPLNETKSFPNESNWQDLTGYILSLEEVPSYTPRGVFEQLVIVTNGGSSRVYIYDAPRQIWKYTSLT